MRRSPSITVSIFRYDVEGDLENLITEADVNSVISAKIPLAFGQQQIEVALQQKKFEVSRTLPDLTIGYFNQTLIGYQNVNGQDQ